MSDPKGLMTTQQFADEAGVSASTVSNWLRSGKIKGSKQKGKWMISADQLATAVAQRTETATAQSAADDKSKPPATAKHGTANAYTVEEFSAMTYLTVFGVERYLKEGRLSGVKDAAGQWMVDASNLKKNNIQKLLRK